MRTTNRSPARNFDLLSGGLLLLGLLLLGTAARGQTAPARPAAPAPAPPKSFTVYFPPSGTEPAKAPEPEPAVFAPGKPLGESPATIVFAALFVLAIAGVLAWRRILSPQCPRCRVKMVELEREDGAADPSGLQVLACLGCREVVKRRWRALATRDLRCPDCQAAAKVARLEVVERPGYLTWGKARIHDECASCTYRRSVDYDVPPLEAPAAAAKLAPRAGR